MLTFNFLRFMRNAKKCVLSLECVGKRCWFVTKFIYFYGSSASALCYMEFDLLQNISFLFKLCIFVNDLIYRARRGLDILGMEVS